LLLLYGSCVPNLRKLSSYFWISRDIMVLYHRRDIIRWRKRNISNIEGYDAIRRKSSIWRLFVRERQINDFNFVGRVWESHTGIFGHYYVNADVSANRLTAVKVGSNNWIFNTRGTTRDITESLMKFIMLSSVDKYASYS